MPVYVIIIDSHLLLTTGTSRWLAIISKSLHIANLAFHLTSLFISYNFKVKSVCVFVYRRRWRYWYIYDALADTLSLKWLGHLLHEWRQWLGFWRILSQYLTLTYMVTICLRKELQGQTFTSTYLLGRFIREYIWYIYIYRYHIYIYISRGIM